MQRVILTIWMGIFLGLVDPSISCPAHFQTIHGCCYHFSDHKNSWLGARSACQRLGGDLAEVGQDEGNCNDVKFMEVVGRKGNVFWFGAYSTDGSRTWKWKRSGRELSLNSNMWWTTDPNPGKKDWACVQTRPGDYTRAKRAFFGTKPCTNRYFYVCQTFT